MAKNDHLENLYSDFYHAASDTIMALEARYHVNGVHDQIFGKDLKSEEAKENFRHSPAWGQLLALYNYAYFGLVGPCDEVSDIVVDGSDVIKLATSENRSPSKEWDDIIAMGDGRFALDDGQDFAIMKLALLAKVDMRTVRNAVSAGILVSYKGDVIDDEVVMVENASARRWLHGRKGFKPTVLNDIDQSQRLEHVDSPAAFAAFLVSQRKRIGLNSEVGKLVVFHPSVDAKAIDQLEAGVFTLPLDAVFPIADFYQVDRKEMLNCVMRVFFANELTMLASEISQRD